MKKLIAYLILGVLVGLFLGMMTYRNNWFPLSLYRTVMYETSHSQFLPNNYPYGIFYIPYSKGVPLFADRLYHNTIWNEELENSHVLQLARHYNHPIQIEIDKDNEILIYRILSKENDNSIFKDWELSDIEVDVKGGSCTHTYVVKKVFKAGVILLQSGGPVASSPIIIKRVSGLPLTSLKVNGFILDNNSGLQIVNNKDADHNNKYH